MNARENQSFWALKWTPDLPPHFFSLPCMLPLRDVGSHHRKFFLPLPCTRARFLTDFNAVKSRVVFEVHLFSEKTYHLLLDYYNCRFYNWKILTELCVVHLLDPSWLRKLVGKSYLVGLKSLFGPKVWEFASSNTQKIILPEMRFNPHQVRLNIRKLRKI